MESSQTSSAAVPAFSGLPVMAMRGKIVEKIMENRVTLIVGETGCGKSSQVPQFLLEDNVEPILCTQPRRFAVVAVAKMVASARNCEVGGEVGYHIGHSRVCSDRSKIVFKTAGVLLDEMRDKGLKALKYKVIVLDEVHERSVESDLVLACIKQFLLKKNDLRVVLMSATADISRYREYFKDLGRGERVEILAIPSTGKNTLFQKNVFYLDQINELLRLKCENLSLGYCSGPSPGMCHAGIENAAYQLIHELVLHIHTTEPDIEKSILVFLPTYQSLEKQWSLLKPLKSFKVHVLHRSIDTEQALKAMNISKSHRKVILATNIAESSVTIPKVGYVIDSCRSLHVIWDKNRKRESAELVWVSKSQAEQRRGRTGRTCDGQVYRLVTGAFYGQLDDYESPALTKLSLRQQTLLLCCAESKIINDPRALLQKVMDPPHPDVVQDALDLLVHLKALEKTYRGSYVPTYYGRLLISFCLSFDSSIIVLKLADMGMLREGILIGILFDLLPLPIFRPFGQEMSLYTRSYYQASSKGPEMGPMEVLYVANFFAFQFWQCAFKDKCRFDKLENIFDISEANDKKILLQKTEEDWCSVHGLVLPALEKVIETYDGILHTLHQYRPKCLIISNSIPVYYDSSKFEHVCRLMHTTDSEAGILPLPDEDHEIEYAKCVDLPYVGADDFCAQLVSTRFVSVLKETRVDLSVDLSGYRSEYAEYSHYNGNQGDDGAAPLCRYFVKGSCTRGTACPFSHSPSAKRPACNFFFSLKGCSNGDSCFFSHDVEPKRDSTFCFPDDAFAEAESLLSLFPSPGDGCVLVLDDLDLRLSSNLVHEYEPSRIVATTSQTDPFDLGPSFDGVRVFWGMGHPSETIMPRREQGGEMIPWSEVKCILWFPRTGDADCGEGLQRGALETFFGYLAIRMLANELGRVPLVVAMNNIRFSRLEVEKVARESFFFLTSSFPLDESRFGRAFGDVKVGGGGAGQMSVSMAVCYVLEMNAPPSEAAEFGDPATASKRRFRVPPPAQDK